MGDSIMVKGNRIKLVVSDMDGTLLNSQREITKENREAIKKAKEQKVLFSICTGRIATMVEYYTNTLEIDTPIITTNGAIIWDPVQKKPLYEIAMDEEELMSILEFCQFHQMDYGALTLGTSFYSKNSIRISRFLEYNKIAKNNGITEMKFEYFDDKHHCVQGSKVYKLLIYDTRPDRLRLVAEYIQTLKKTGYTSSEHNLIDASEARVNKGFGIRKLAELLKFTPEEVCAIGDYENDIPMLDFAGFPVVMGNASQDLKKHAVFVTKSNEESGVAWVMNQYILNK